MKKSFFTIILFSFTYLFSYSNQLNNENETKTKQHKTMVRFTDFPCYAVSEDNGPPNVFFEYDPSTNSWISIGITGTESIEALATDPVNEIVFAVDGGTFGFIDQNTAKFTAIGEIGFGNGDFGQISLDDIDGLTYDFKNQIMYATHRISGAGPGTNDLLFLIDIATGSVVRSAMINSNGNFADYAVIQETIDEEYGNDIYDVEDIAWNPYTGQLFSIINQNSSGVVAELESSTGKINAVVRDLSIESSGGLGVSYLGELFANTKVSNGQMCIINVFAYGYGFENPFCYDFDSKVEAFDCSTAFNDLALSLELDPTTQQPITGGSEITFTITIQNQGDIDNTNITLTNYTPQGLTLSDANWTELSNGTAILNVDHQLKSGTDFEIPVTFLINSDYIGTAFNAVEITSTFNYDITDDLGNPIPLPDVDSNPDDNSTNDCLNCDIDIPDLVYEDDFGIVNFSVEQVDNLAYMMIDMKPENCNALGSATIQILSGGMPPFTHKWVNIAGETVHNQTTNYPQHQIPNLKSGGYYVTITDAINQANTFSTIVPFIAPLEGNANCINTCPEYVIVPTGSASGNFMAEEILEIKGYVEKINNALFDICE